MNPEAVLLAFKRLNVACFCFERAGALAQHMADTNLAKESPLYSPMMAGVVVTYARPFVPCYGLGSLPVEFSRLADVDLKSTHDDLIAARHRLYAHTDAEKARDLKLKGGSPPPFETRVTIKEAGGFDVEPGVVEALPESLGQIAALCRHQRDRVEAAVRKLWPALTGGRKYAPGNYVVGVDFP